MYDMPKGKVSSTRSSIAVSINIHTISGLSVKGVALKSVYIDCMICE